MQFGRPIKDFLHSIGFQFTDTDSSPSIPEKYNLERLITKRHYRISCRGDVGGTKYGEIFEHVVYQLLMRRFRFDVLQRVKIENEGAGGDYDILAFQSPYLHYIECKTGKNIKFQEIIRRHQFLRPSLTLILIDRPKEDMPEIINKEIRPVLTTEAKKKDANLKWPDDFKYPVELISDTDEGIVLYHTYRNIFIASGEDLDRTIRKTLRYFHQVVSQSSYLS